MSKQFFVSWIDGDAVGIYTASDADGAILAAVQDAGYRSLSAAAKFIYSHDGEITLQAQEFNPDA